MIEARSSEGEGRGGKIARGPSGNLFLGILPEVRRDVLGLFRNIAREHREVARYRFGPVTSHLAVHPDAVRRVLQDNVTNYTKAHFSYSMLRWLVPNGVLTADGASWLRQRRLVQPAFHRQRIVEMAEGMAAAAQALCERWTRQADAREAIPVSADMMHLTLDIVARALFGAAVDEREVSSVSRSFSEISRQLTGRFRSLHVLPPVLPTQADRAFRGAMKELNGVVAAIIARRRGRAEDTGDLLSMLMLAQDEDSGERMDDDQLRDEVLTMLVAGHETTAALLSWTWVLLAQHPEVERRLHDELDEVLAGRAPAVEDLPKLPYTRMILDETMRLYPPLYILSRKVVADDEVMGYRIPKGSWMDLSPFATHRHPDFWEDPERFDPERFSPERARDRPRYAYFPFLGGPRQCIGNTFALVEAQLVLATLAQSVRLSLPVGARVVAEPLVTLRPSMPPMIAKRRRT